MNVNTRVAENHLMDKYKNILEDELVKPGFGLGKAKLKTLKER